MVEIRIDPEFQQLIPPMSSEEREQLEDSLTREGCRDALIVWTTEHGDGVPLLLDGHHRYSWCTTHGKPFKLMEVVGVENREDAKIWIIRNQLGRRNLPDYERIRLALLKEEILSTQREQNRLANLKRGDEQPDVANLQHRGRTVETVAKDASVSPRTVHKVQVIEREADEVTKDALRQGGRSIHSAYQELRPQKAKTDLAAPQDSATQERQDNEHHPFELQEPIYIPDPFHDQDDVEDEHEEVMGQWFQTLQHLLVEVGTLERQGIKAIIETSSETEFPQFIAILTSLRDRLNRLLVAAENVSVNVIDIEQ